ncbi:MAG: MarR family transcriptional regulator [Solirubrobacterales bacterium]
MTASRPDQKGGRDEQAAETWATMRELAFRHPSEQDQRDALGLGRGTGRIRALMTLTDGPLPISALAEAAAFDPPYATLVVDSLEERGLVARLADPTDRRRKLVKLTAAGKKAAAKLTRIRREPPAGFATLSARDLDTLSDLIHRIAAADGDDV